MPTTFSATTFEPLLDDCFCVAQTNVGAVDLILARVTPHGRRDPDKLNNAIVVPASVRQDGFSLIFSGPVERGLEQNTYEFRHPTLGAFPLFIVPVGMDEEGRYLRPCSPRRAVVGAARRKGTHAARPSARQLTLGLCAPVFLSLTVRAGAAERVRIVYDINPGVGDSGPANLFAFGATALFSADDGVHGRELWSSDGLSFHTVLVKDIRAGAAGSNPAGLTVLETGNGLILFFSADDGTGLGLWAIDGTGPPVLLLKPTQSGAGSVPQGIVALNGHAFFAANGGSDGSQLWVTDGTSGGTRLVQALNGPGDFAGPKIMGVLNGHVLFAARGISGGTQRGVELWSSDGTSVSLTQDINPGSGSSMPSALTVFNGAAYFSASANGFNNELWTSTGAGASLVKEINPDTSGAEQSGSDPANFTPFLGKLYFTARRPAEGEELWATDGTGAGTVLVDDINPGAASSSPRDFTAVNGCVLFSAQTATAGRELYALEDGANTPPTASPVTVTPLVPIDTDDLSLTYTYTDPDSDPEGPTGIFWYCNGARQYDLDGQKTVSNTRTQPGDTWYAVVIPVDSRGAEGAPAQSNTVTIVAAIPGDVNHSGHVDAVDVQLVINAALGLK